ncbi:efflux RND transporter periplasmic adaptor subunit [Kordiimonas marina]|uniref:efflux RND transporter periplasmic adaptor subunit n=1 Tax=Kordiimonas marina TaxID=2872312 RepID=UPI001FF655B0|nr:efflux RND transporter periplasmic adaptor subunit [Kordiimonas marina]MCJ9429047.1 efflux RND transporter periplasmic adaptor subunit [Kordiimonas marina]
MKPGRIVLAAVFLVLAGASVWLIWGPRDKGAQQRHGGTLTVVTQPVTLRPFTDIVEALGTAKASESVTLNARVSDTIRAVKFDDGQLVKKGDVLVNLEDREEKAKLQEAEANQKEAERQFKRTRDLVKKGNASTAALDAAQRTLDEARFRVDAAQARLNDQRVVAPFDGVLGLRQVSEGSLITPSTPITTIDAINLIYLDFSVPERFLARLKPGQEVEAKVEAYPGRLFKGRVKTVDSRVDPVTRSVIVRAEIPNEDKLLRPGILMTVDLISRSWNGLSVPEEAVVPTGGKDYVFVVENGTAHRRAVSLGIRRPGYVEVTQGVKEGDRVVTEGTLRLGSQPVPVREAGDEPKASAGSAMKGAAQ